MADGKVSSSEVGPAIGRIVVLCLLVLAVVYGLAASVIEYSFASDPLGPRVFPVALAIVLGILVLWELLVSGPAEEFPFGLLLARILALPVLMAGAVALFEPAGFIPSVFVLTSGSALIFGATVVKALIGAVVQVALWWFVFSFLLEVYLPAGALLAG